MRVATIYWNGEEAEVRWTDDFLSSDWLVRADALQDISGQTQEQYRKTLLDLDIWHKKIFKKAIIKKGKKS